MKIIIDTIDNGLLVKIEAMPTPGDPLAQRGSGTWFARDTTDALGRIAQHVKQVFDPILDRVDNH